MASLVPNNPFDTSQQKFAGTGDVTGQITGGARNGMNWDFMDQQGKVLTSIPYQEFVDNYQSDGYGAVRQGVNAVNGVPVYNFSGGGAAQAPTSPGIIASAQPAAAVAPVAPTNQGIVGGAINNVSTGQNAAAQNLAQFNPASDMSLQTYTPQTREVNQATETAAGQVNSLLADDNPLLQRARTIARQNMAQRGLVNSSMAQGAGVAAMVDRITPIAQQDAQTYSNRALANMETTNEANQFNVNQNNQFLSQGLNIAANKDLQSAQQTFQTAQADLDRAFQAAQQDKSIAAQMNLQTAQQNFSAAQANLDRQQQLMISSSQIASNERLTLAQIDATAKNLNTSNAAQMEQLKTQIENNKTEAGKNYAVNITATATAQINALLGDPNLDPAAKQAAIDNVIKNTNASLQWASTFYNTTLPSFTASGGTSTAISPTSSVQAAGMKSAIGGAAGTSAGVQAAINYGNSKGLTPQQTIDIYNQLSGTNFTVADYNSFVAANGSGAANTQSSGGATTPRYTVEAPAAPTSTTAAQSYFQANPDVAAAYQQNSYGMSPETFAATHYANYGVNEGRAAPAAAATSAAPAPSKADISSYVTNVLSNGGPPEQQAAAIKQAAASEGVSREQIAEATGYSLAQVNAFLK